MVKFFFGVVGSGKTNKLLYFSKSFKIKGVGALAITVDVADEPKSDKLKVALGKEVVTLNVYPNDISMGYLVMQSEMNDASVLFIDGAHLLSTQDVEILIRFGAFFNKTIFCFGLRTDYMGKSYVGASHLLAFADEIEEIGDYCWCGQKANYSAAFAENYGIIRDKEAELRSGQLTVKHLESINYIGLCSRHFRLGKCKNGAYSDYKLNAFIPGMEIDMAYFEKMSKEPNNFYRIEFGDYHYNYFKSLEMANIKKKVKKDV